jgi:DNA-binding helix-hairpin-helix protein with protein kinase domain
MTGMVQGLKLTAEPGGEVQLGQLIGAGGQGEVYHARVAGQEKALKWYFPDLATRDQRNIIEGLVAMPHNDARFLWPEALVVADQPDAGFGYLMRLRPPEFVGLPALFRRRVRTTPRAQVTACIHLAEAYRELHSRGIAYRDISWGNVFFAPADGRVLVCDNDNAIFEGQESGVSGTMEFMAPELVREEAEPGTQSDLHSLAVLLFMILVNHHPLRGAQELKIHCLDAAAQRRLYGEQPMFIFDPDNKANGPVRGEHDGVMQAWETLPTALRTLFVAAFTRGLRDPSNGRVRESQWRDTLSRVRDAIVACAACGRHNMYDETRHRKTGSAGFCWHPSCRRALVLPPRLLVQGRTIMLNRDAEVYPHHLDHTRQHDFANPVAVLTEHPQRPGSFGLTNKTSTTWSASRSDGSTQPIGPGRTVPLRAGLTILIGGVLLEVRAASTP